MNPPSSEQQSDGIGSTALGSGRSGSAFVTQDEGDGAIAVASHAVAASATGNGKMLKVEDESYAAVMEATTAVPPLPRRVDPEIVCLAVADSLKFKNLSSHASWRKMFLKPACQHFVQATFWYVFMESFILVEDKKARPSSAENTERKSMTRAAFDECQAALFKHLSHSLVEVFLSCSRQKKDAFLSKFPDAVAQSVYLAYLTAYPASKFRFDQAFKEMLISKVASWVFGVTAPKSFDLSHWGLDNTSKPRGSVRRIMFDLESSAGKKKKASQKSEERKNLVNTVAVTEHSRFEISTSPLIANVLGSDGAKDPRSFKMTQSIRVYKPACPDYSHMESLLMLQDGTEEKSDSYLESFSSETYQDVVARSEAKRKSLLDEYKTRRRTLSTELKQLKQTWREQQQEIEQNKRRAIKGDIHELSNYLVSTWRVDDS